VNQERPFERANFGQVDDRGEGVAEREARSVAKGETPAAVSHTRLRELYNDMKADYRNKSQRGDVLEGDGSSLKASSETI
jgi:hypothetical protein